MALIIRYSANASSDHQPKNVPGMLNAINPMLPYLPICSVVSTKRLCHLLMKLPLHLTAKIMLGIIIAVMNSSP